MPQLTPINQYSLIGRTVKYIDYIQSKRRVVIKLEDDSEVMFVSYWKDATKLDLFNKNHRKCDYTKIKNIQIKDLGWDSFLLSVRMEMSIDPGLPLFTMIVY